jgi:hypothetical protein
MNPEAIKESNTKYLQEIGIEVIDWLPYLDRTDFRRSNDVAKRSVILAAFFQLSLGAPNEFIESYLKSNDLYQNLTTLEKKQLSTEIEKWPEQERIDLDWSIEAVWALQWVGGKHESLTFNTYVEDSLSSMLPEFHKNESAQNYIESFILLSEEKIFTELDKFYRAHWFAKNNDLTNNKNDKVHTSIIMERRKALEWVCDKSLTWDDISLDT